MNRGVFTVSPDSRERRRTGRILLVTDRKGLLSEVQMNTLEFHTWGSRVETLGEALTLWCLTWIRTKGWIGKKRNRTQDLKGLLDQLGLKAYLKTSWREGYHIVIPFRPAADWTAFHGCRRDSEDNGNNEAQSLYEQCRKEQRKGRIFIDWIRNGRGPRALLLFRCGPGRALPFPRRFFGMSLTRSLRTALQ